VAGHLLEQDVLYSIVFGVPLYNLPRCRDPIEKTAGIDDCTMRPWLIRDAWMVVFPVPKVAWWRYDFVVCIRGGAKLRRILFTCSVWMICMVHKKGADGGSPQKQATTENPSPY